MLIILYHTADRNLQVQFVQHFQGNIDLPPAAVHHDQVRETCKTAEFLIQIFLSPGFLLIQAVHKTPSQDFFHTGIVIWSLHRFDTEFSVIAAFWLTLLIDDHGTYRLESADIGNIIGLYPLQSRQGQFAGNLFHSTDGSALLTLDTLLVLAEYKLCVPLGQLHQLFLGSFLRNPYVHFPSLSLFQPLSDHFAVLNLLLDHDFFWNKGCSRIELFQEAGNDLGPLVLLGNFQVEMIPSYELAAADKEYLRHCVLSILGNRHNVLVLPMLVCDLLPLPDPLYTLYQIPVLGCILKIHLLGGCQHLFFQFF